MRLALHDIILASAGDPHPEARTRISDAARTRWLGTMRELLSAPEAGGGWFSRNLDVAGHALRMAASRHGDAVAAVWGAGPARAAVAASVLLAGRNASDDAAALAALRSRRPPLPLGEDEFRAVEAQARPCLVTLYLDARWYDNARVELAATALAAAALSPADAAPRASADDTPGQEPATRPARQAPPSPPRGVFAPQPRAGPAPAAAARSALFRDISTPLPFNFTRERLRVVMGMVAKKTTATLQRRPGPHFTVEPPEEYLARPDALQGDQIFEQLKDTEWRVRWYDRSEERLGFGEFLGFLEQVRMTEEAAVPAAAARRASAGTPGSAAEAQRAQSAAPPVTFQFTINVRQLVTDETIRRLFAGNSAHFAPGPAGPLPPPPPAAITSPPA